MRRMAPGCTIDAREEYPGVRYVAYVGRLVPMEPSGQETIP